MSQVVPINNEAYKSSPASQYMCLSIANMTLLTKQSNISSIESVLEIDCSNSLNGSIGWINYKNNKIPVYRINNEFELIDSMPREKMICVVLNNNDTYISMACKEIYKFDHHVVKVDQIPECMKSDISPIEALCLYKNKSKSDINFVVNAESLIKYFSFDVNQ